MTDPDDPRWIIRRRNAVHPVHGHPYRYVTGPTTDPETGDPRFGSTDDPFEATTYPLADAEHHVRNHWRGLKPEVLPAPPYDPADD